MTLHMLTPMPAGTRHRQPGRPSVLVADIIGSAWMQRLAAAALARRVIVVGDGATMPEPSIRPAANLRVPVRPPVYRD